MSDPLSAVGVDRLAAANLRRLRIGKGLSAAKLARDLGLMPARIRDIEQGLERLPVDILVRAADHMDVRVERFFEDAPGCEVAA